MNGPRTIEELQAEIDTLTAQNVILGMGIEEIIYGAQAIKDKAIAIHERSQAANAPSAVGAEIAKLKAEVARLSAPVSDAETVALTGWLMEQAEKTLTFARSRREYAGVNKNLSPEDRKVAHRLAEQMSGRKLPKQSRSDWEKYCAAQNRIAGKLEAEAAMLNRFAGHVAIIAARRTPPAHGDAPAQKEQPK